MSPCLLSESVSGGKVQSLLTFREGFIAPVCASLEKAAWKPNTETEITWSFEASPVIRSPDATIVKVVTQKRISKSQFYNLFDLVKMGPNLGSFIKMGKYAFI